MQNYFKDKTIWVVGASSGIGEALVRELAKTSCKIILSARRENELFQIAQSLHLLPENHLILPLDISLSNTFDEKIQVILNTFNQIDIVILNAGIAHKSFAEDTLENVDRQIIEVNFMGNILLTKKIITQMKTQQKGTIAVTSSILGEIGLPYVSTYCASKHAIVGYFESLRYEVEKYHINICILQPGFIQTAITKNALTGTGEVYNQDSLAQEKGMPASTCAKKMLAAIKNEKNRAKIGGLEILMPTFAYYFPRLFYYLMKKMHKIS